MRTLRQSLMMVTLTIATSVVAVVACAPASNETTVEVPPSSREPGTSKGFEKAVDECRDQIHRFDSTRVNGAREKTGGTRPMTAICRVKDKGVAAQFAKNSSTKVQTDAEIAVPEYEVAEVPLRYKVDESSGKLSIGLRVGVRVSEKTPEKTKEHILAVLNRYCHPRIKETWNEKKLGVALALPEFEMIDDEFFEPSSVDQVMTLVGPKNLGINGFPVFVLENWPDRGGLYSSGRASEMQKCASSEDPDCKYKEYIASNLPFCRNVALLVGQWLGLRSPEAISGNCDQRTGSDDAAEASPYLKALLEAKEGEFSAKAAVSEADVRKILAPICPSISQASKESKHLAAD